MPDLSIIIPARQEEFLQLTIDDILRNMRGSTEMIVVLDGYWPDTGIPINPLVTVVHDDAKPDGSTPGQRAAINKGMRLADSRFVMKVDAHCAFDEGFDVKLMADCEYDWTVIPRMYNLHVFDWVCGECGHPTYQGPKPTQCEECKAKADFEKVIVWKPRLNRRTDFARFDADLRFKYWKEYAERPESEGDVVDTMCSVGAAFFMHRERFWELGGVDEKHGSWGQSGVEMACKAWLSGGRHVVNKKTWFSHLFRTQPGFGFPYPASGRQHEAARKYSRQLWQGNTWKKATRPFKWILQKFHPVPDWDDQPTSQPSAGLIYYTDGECPDAIATAVRQQIERVRLDRPVMSASLFPLDFGDNLVVRAERGAVTMFRQILAALESSKAEVVFFCEHDVFYHPTHFDFVPPRRDVYYYNENVWKVDTKTGYALFYAHKGHKGVRQVSGLVAYRDLLVRHYTERLRRITANPEISVWRMGFEPGKPLPRGVDDVPAEGFWSEHPNVDICHPGTFTPNRWRLKDFRRKPATWRLEDEIPFWGRTAGRFSEWLREVSQGAPESLVSIRPTSAG